MTPSTSKPPRRRRAATLLALVAGVLAIGATPAAAATCRSAITVADHADDGGRTQLRQAIADACPGALIRIAPGTVTLSQGQLTVAKDLRLLGIGPSSRPIVIDGAGASRVLLVTGATVSLTNLKITGGSADSGAGIRNAGGTLSLSGVAVTGNTATVQGGGLENVASGGASVLTIVDSVVKNNTAPFGGGAVNVATDGGSASMTLSGTSVVEANAGGTGFGDRGGGLANLAFSGSTATLVAKGGVTVRQNTAFNGAGIANASEDAGVATVTVDERASVSANTGVFTGGGLTNDANGGGTSTMQLAGDAVVADNTTWLTGGGVSNQVGTGTARLVLTDRASITRNTAAAAGGVFNNPGAGIATVEVSGSATIAGNVPDDCWGC